MVKISQFLVILVVSVQWFSCSGESSRQQPTIAADHSDLSEHPPAIDATLVLGIERTDRYLPILKGKKVAVVANQTSVLGNRHLVDILLENKVEVVRVFAPEHGFRGAAGPGDKE
ncbi:MAG: exo-beta-N-acetylmuramidase NamZ domain-containing protein, partial [Bacteroidia bacterium]